MILHNCLYSLTFCDHNLKLFHWEKYESSDIIFIWIEEKFLNKNKIQLKLVFFSEIKLVETKN